MEVERSDLAKMVRNGSLTAKQDLALTALMSAPSIGEAAEIAKVGQRTLYRWLAHDENFKAAYLQSRREVMGHTVAQLQQSTGAAVEALKAIMSSSAEPASARVSAAKVVLEMAVKGMEVLDMELRICALENERGHVGGKAKGRAP